MAAALSLSPSLVSHHLRLLRAARVVRAERHGKQVFYVAADRHIGRTLSEMLEHVAERGDQAIGSFATAAFALAAMAGLAVWASGPPKLFCALIGTLVGYAVAAAFHVYPASFFADF